MPNPSEQELTNLLVKIVSDGFNRSLGVLQDERVVDSKKMAVHYRGTGSKLYDLVTKQIEQTATWAAPAVRDLFEKSS